MGLLDFARGRMLARVGARLQSILDPVSFEVAMGLRRSTSSKAGEVMNDLETVQKFYSSPVFMAFFDLPWTPLFLGALFIFHSMLGWFAIAGGGLLVILALGNQMITRDRTRAAQSASQAARAFAGQARQGSAILRSQGMQRAMQRRWLHHRGQALDKTISSSDWTGGFAALTKTFRMFLQSAILGLGAWLTLRGEMTGGSMIAGSILMGRALAPIEQSITQWAVLQRMRQAWNNLKTTLAETEEPRENTKLPRPSAHLDVCDVTVLAPGHDSPILNQVAFQLEPASALGVIGTSGSGKSTLARVIMGIAAVARGEVRLGHATYQQYGPEEFARHVGYLPQDIVLFDGTIAENISALPLRPDDGQVVAPARQAKAHEWILALPDG
jgi:ATP-binding cassette subfamily C protein